MFLTTEGKLFFNKLVTNWTGTWRLFLVAWSWSLLRKKVQSCSYILLQAPPAAPAPTGTHGARHDAAPAFPWVIKVAPALTQHSQLVGTAAFKELVRNLSQEHSLTIKHEVKRSAGRGSKVQDKMWQQHFTLHQKVSWIASQTFHQALLPSTQRRGHSCQYIIINRAGFSIQFIHSHPSSPTSRGHGTTKTHGQQTNLQHHHIESKFSCFVNLHWFYCSSLLQFIHFPMVFPVVPSASLGKYISKVLPTTDSQK